MSSLKRKWNHLVSQYVRNESTLEHCQQMIIETIEEENWPFDEETTFNLYEVESEERIGQKEQPYPIL